MNMGVKALTVLELDNGSGAEVLNKVCDFVT